MSKSKCPSPKVKDQKFKSKCPNPKVQVRNPSQKVEVRNPSPNTKCDKIRQTVTTKGKL